MTGHDSTQPDRTQPDLTQADPTRGEDTEVVDRVDATRPVEVGGDEPRRQGVADLLDGPAGDDADHRPAPAPAPHGARTTADPVVQAPPPAPTGPHVPAILLGIISLAVAGLVLAQELGDLTLDWGDIGPLGIALTGGVLVLFGLLGLLSSRRKGA